MDSETPPGGAGGIGASPGKATADAKEVEAKIDTLTKEVTELKKVLDDPSSSQDALLKALNRLRDHGALPTKVLSATLIGKTVNQIAKASPIKAVSGAALGLVNEWKQTHRKRKASSAGLDGMKRTESLDSEAAFGSQPSEGLTSKSFSKDSLSIGEAEGRSPDKPSKEKARMTPQREKVLQKLVEALGQAEKLEVKDGSDDQEEHQKDPAIIAAEIEENLNDELLEKATEKDYLNQARAILFNLKDKRNHQFKFKVLVGFIKPDTMAKLTAKEMASEEKNAEREKMRQDAMAAIDQDWAMKNGQIRISGMFTCGKCKGTQTTYFQMQTRSSDEPMTTFATCLTCGNRWKFC